MRALPLLVLAGCASLLSDGMADPKRWPDGGAAAVDVALKCVNLKHRPRILVVTKGLDCKDGKGWKAATMGGQCVGGVWAPGAVTVAHRAGDRWSDSALPTELEHERVYQVTGVVWGVVQEYTPEFLAAVENTRNCMREKERRS